MSVYLGCADRDEFSCSLLNDEQMRTNQLYSNVTYVIYYRSARTRFLERGLIILRHRHLDKWVYATTLRTNGFFTLQWQSNYGLDKSVESSKFQLRLLFHRIHGTGGCTCHNKNNQMQVNGYDSSARFGCGSPQTSPKGVVAVWTSPKNGSLLKTCFFNRNRFSKFIYGLRFQNGMMCDIC